MHPFRFYGARPNHWHDDALIYELCFVSAPDAACREALAEAYARAIHGTAIGGERAWLWGGRFALLEVERRIRSELYSVPADMPEVLRAVHALAPLEQVVFHGATECGDPWSAWSEEQRAPLPGPAWKGWAAPFTFSGPYSVREGRIDDPTPQDPAFEAARARAAAEVERAAGEARAREAEEAGTVALVPVADPPKAPDATPPSRALKLLMAERAIGAGEYWVSLIKNTVRVAHLGEDRRLEDVELPLAARCAALRPDGLLAVADEAALHLIDLSRDADDAGRERSFEAYAIDAHGFVAGGRALVVAWSEKAFPTAVLGVDGDEVVELVRLETEIRPHGARIYEVGGRAFTTGACELVGVEGALARAADDPRTDFDLTDDWFDG